MHPSQAILWFCVLICLPWSPLWLKQWWMEQSDTGEPWPLNSPLMSLVIVVASMVTFYITCLFNLSSIFLLKSRPWRLAIVPWTLDFWMICSTGVTQTLNCLEMVSSLNKLVYNFLSNQIIKYFWGVTIIFIQVGFIISFLIILFSQNSKAILLLLIIIGNIVNSISLKLFLWPLSVFTL